METIILWLIASYLGLTALYLLFFTVASFFKKMEPLHVTGKENRILILLIVDKENATIIESARKALNLSYNKTKFNVMVIAESLQGIFKLKLKSMGCKIVMMDLQPRSKAKAIKLALSQVPNHQYDIALVLDADNHLSQDALIQINSSFNAGARAVQCQRMAKEITTPVSMLDAISEGINNTIFRKGHRSVGLSAALSGSGVAFEYLLFKNVMSQIEATNDFDKDLEFEIISSGTKIEYLEKVHVFEEKVSTLEALKNQCTRWFTTQVIYIKKGFYFFTRKPSIDLFDKWWQMWVPSRLLLVGFMAFMSLFSLLFENPLLTKFILSTFISTSLALMLAAPKKYTQQNSKTILLHLPASFLTLIISALSIQNPGKDLIHASHSDSNHP